MNQAVATQEDWKDRLGPSQELELGPGAERGFVWGTSGESEGKRDGGQLTESIEVRSRVQAPFCRQGEAPGSF